MRFAKHYNNYNYIVEKNTGKYMLYISFLMHSQNAINLSYLDHINIIDCHKVENIMLFERRN